MKAVRGRRSVSGLLAEATPPRTGRTYSRPRPPVPPSEPSRAPPPPTTQRRSPSGPVFVTGLQPGRSRQPAPLRSMIAPMRRTPTPRTKDAAPGGRRRDSGRGRAAATAAVPLLLLLLLPALPLLPGAAGATDPGPRARPLLAAADARTPPEAAADLPEADTGATPHPAPDPAAAAAAADLFALPRVTADIRRALGAAAAGDPASAASLLDRDLANHPGIAGLHAARAGVAMLEDPPAGGPRARPRPPRRCCRRGLPRPRRRRRRPGLRAPRRRPRPRPAPRRPRGGTPGRHPGRHRDAGPHRCRRRHRLGRQHRVEPGGRAPRGALRPAGGQARPCAPRPPQGRRPRHPPRALEARPRGRQRRRPLRQPRPRPLGAEDRRLPPARPHRLRPRGPGGGARLRPSGQSCSSTARPSATPRPRSPAGCSGAASPASR